MRGLCYTLCVKVARGLQKPTCHLLTKLLMATVFDEWIPKKHLTLLPPSNNTSHLPSPNLWQAFFISYSKTNYDSKKTPTHFCWGCTAEHKMSTSYVHIFIIFKDITHGGFFMYINLGILSLSTEPWNGTRSMRISP